MGYRDEGNFNTGFENNIAIEGLQSAPFIFPSRSIRFLEGENHLERLRASRDGSSVSSQTYNIHRGYIRNLEQPQIGSVPISKCSFQFNPQEIRQSVAMREDMYVQVLQDPAQLAQPIGALMNFQFDLLFDRSMEVARGSVGYSADPDNPNPTRDVYDIGVLADLRVLYNVIGQGLSKDMLDFQASNWSEIATAQYNADQAATNSASVPPVEQTAEQLWDSEKVRDIMEANYGNSAFLMPNPVRVMFSSLFMLDGFITGTNVDFLKFSTNMVPLQCKVAMSMSAVYIGFAKKDTFITKQFASAAKFQQDQKRLDAQVALEIKAALQRTASPFVVSITAETPNSNNDIDDMFSSTTGNERVWMFAVEDDEGKVAGGVTGRWRAMYTGFPKVTPVEGGEDVTTSSGTGYRVGADKDAVLALYEATQQFTINIQTTINVRAQRDVNSPNPDAKAVPGWTLEEANNALLYYKGSGTQRSDDLLVGSYSFTDTASSKEEWGYGASGEGSKSARVRRRSRHAEVDNKKFNNVAPARFMGEPSEDFKSSYFVVGVTANISFSTPGGTSVSKSQSKWFVASGNSPLSPQSFTFEWLETVDEDPLTPRQAGAL